MTEKLDSKNSDCTTHEDGLEISASKAVYNIMTDTVTGINYRKSDNRFQAICIVASVVISSLIGTTIAIANASLELPWWVGALAGAFIGLIAGVLCSGALLMIYRSLRHLKGKHD